MKLLEIAIIAALAFSAFSHAEEAPPPLVTEADVRSDGFRVELRSRAAFRANDLRKAQKNAEDEDERDDIRDELDILDYVIRSLSGPASDSAISVRRNVDAARILFALEFENDEAQLPPMTELFSNVFFGTLFGHGVPLVTKKKQDKPVGEAAAIESWLLHDPSRATYFTTSELSRFSPAQIAALDIGPEHPEWLPWKEAEASRQNRVADFEAEMERLVAAELRRDGDLAAGRPYHIDKARRVLFLEKIELSATSPKAETEDVFGVEWKLKWGDEPAVEPVASRLYLLAGARMTDLVLPNGSGAAGTTLVLEKPGSLDEDEQTDEKRDAETVGQLKTALLDLYGFDIEPYILDHGTITPANLGAVLARLPHGGKKKYRPEELIGREWATFRESSVELDPKGAIRREDGAPLFDQFAPRDRVGRSLYLFDLWIENRDVKYDNRKAYFLLSSVPGGGKRITGYREAHHDLGLSLGGLLSSGQTNRLRTGDRFSPDTAGPKARFKAPMIFKPAAWDHITWSDAVWMARHIASIDEAMVRDAVSYSFWPDFVQEALVHRLLIRRDQIARTFGVSDLISKPAPEAPTIRVPLSTPEEIVRAEKRYGLEAGTLATELSLPPRRPIAAEEVVVRDGAIADGRQSALVRALVRDRFPSGLAVRYKRRNDRPPPELR